MFLGTSIELRAHYTLPIKTSGRYAYTNEQLMGMGEVIGGGYGLG